MRPTPSSYTAALAVSAVSVFSLLLVAPPAAADEHLISAPVGGSQQLECLFVCVVDEAGAACNSPANQGGTLSTVATSVPFSISGFRRGNAPSGSSNPCASAVPVNLPVNLAPGQVLFFDLGFAPKVPGLHDGNIHIEGSKGSQPLVADIPIVGEATGGNATAPCVPGGTTLCLSGNRFKVQVDWATSQGTSGPGMVVPFQTTDSGLFWFFDVNNWETVVKVLNACPVNDRFWVFASGLTNVETVITVTDTQEGRVRTYVNPQETPFQPVQDTSAFATCP